MKSKNVSVKKLLEDFFLISRNDGLQNVVFVKQGQRTTLKELLKWTNKKKSKYRRV